MIRMIAVHEVSDVLLKRAVDPFHRPCQRSAWHRDRDRNRKPSWMRDAGAALDAEVVAPP
jgi:hypothetical protein